MALPLGTACDDDLSAAYRRLNAAYQQALRCGIRRVLYQQMQRGIIQFCRPATAEAKDFYTRGHSER